MELKVGLDEDPVELRVDFDPFFHAHFERVARAGALVIRDAAAGQDLAPVTVGGLDGVRLDLELYPDWDRTCFYSEGKPVVPLVYSSAFPGGYNWAICPRMSMRWYVLDAGNRVLIVDIEDNLDGLTRDDLFRSGTEIVDSMVFSSTS